MNRLLGPALKTSSRVLFTLGVRFNWLYSFSITVYLSSGIDKLNRLLEMLTDNSVRRLSGPLAVCSHFPIQVWRILAS